MAADDFREGFLCSICKRDMKSLPQLQDHFDSAHREDKAVFHQLLGFFGRAKRKLLGDTLAGDVEASDVGRIRGGSTTSLGEGGIDPVMWEPQGPGACRSHWELFKMTRDRCVNQLAIETNKILIRLERFVTERRSRSKKDHEIVDWMPDSEAKFCWECQKPFGMGRRRHHCRLTGEVICAKCSEFFPLQMAVQVLQPAMVGSERERKLSPSGDKDDDDEIRVSHSCYQLLRRKQRETKEQESKPVLVQLYDRMKMFMDEADTLLPRYRSLADALNSGDETSSLDIAQGMRARLIKLHETIDLISKRIMAIGVQSEDPISPRQTRLQKCVRQFASGYLQCNMIATVPLPNPQQLQELQEERKRVQAERTRKEREEAQKAAERVKQMQLHQRKEQTPTNPVRMSDMQRTSGDSDTHRGDSSSQRRSRALSGSGWQPTVNLNLDTQLETRDPLEIQRDMLTNYIEQAKAAGRQDELAALREALEDIEYQLAGKTRY